MSSTRDPTSDARIGVTRSAQALSSSTMNLTIGSPRLWCRETPQYSVGVSASLAVIAGYPSTWIWSLPDGELVARWASRPLDRDVVSIERDGDALVADTARERRRFDLAMGDLLSTCDPVPSATITLDANRTTATVTQRDGSARSFAVPWSYSATVARDGARFAVSSPSVTRVYDALEGGVVFECARSSVPRLSSDGTRLLLTMLGPPRTRVYDVDTATLLGPDEPTHFGDVMLGDDVVIIDDGAWSLDDGRRIASFDGAYCPLWIDRDTLISKAHRSLARWNLRTGERTRSIELEGDVESASVDASGRFAALTQGIARGLLYIPIAGVFLADFERSTLARIDGLADDVSRDVAISADACCIAIAGGDLVREVDREGVALRDPFEREGASRVAYSPDGSTLAVWWSDNEGSSVTLYEEGRERATLSCRSCEVLGWWGDDLLRSSARRYERLDARTLEVVANWTPDEATYDTWFGDRDVAESAGDGTLRIRTLRWEPAIRA